MTAGDAALLAALPGLAFHAVLVFCRLGAAVMLLPGIGEAEIPPMLRMALGLGLVLSLLPVLAPELPAMPEAPGPLVVSSRSRWWWAVVRAAGAGADHRARAGRAGHRADDRPRLALAGGHGAGRRGDGVGAAVLAGHGGAGAGFGAVRDPAARPGRELRRPAGGGLPAGVAAEALAGMAAHSIALSLQIAAPFVLAAMLSNAALGLLARLAPQSQVFVVATPVQVLGGFLLLGLLLPALLGLWSSGMGAGLLRLPGLG
jgi:flagellar biosynthetic protein FliR